MNHRPVDTLLVLLFLLFSARGLASDSVYNPLAIPPESPPQVVDLAVDDHERKREIPVRVYLPSEPAPAPVVLFSHGLGGSRNGNAYLGKHWAARGYVAVFLHHPGSDSSVWKTKPQGGRMNAMQEAANGANFLLRVQDIPAALDQFERWNGTDGHPLAWRLDLERIGMSGHSFGAVTTQAVSGQRVGPGHMSLTDSRIKAAIALSPSSPRRGDTKTAFGEVKMPWMLMTGTKDIAAIGGADLNSRLGVFPALPPGNKYELVLYGAEHSAFSDRDVSRDTGKRNPNHHRAVLALSTAFWDTYLRRDEAAKRWLDGDGARSVLQEGDRWQTK